jgi:hypothetical protein
LENTANVEFRQHNFFQPQPSTPDVKAFLLRHVLHNYNDADCIRILSALVPALEAQGASASPILLINEGVVPEFGEWSTRDLDLTIRRGDLCMLVTLSAQERTRRQFQTLLSAADLRLQVSCDQPFVFFIFYSTPESSADRLQIHGVYGNGVTRLIEVHLNRE